jgi:hypothetical protein
VGLGYASLAFALVKSTNVANAIAWAIMIGGLGIIVGLLIELNTVMGAESNGVKVIQGQGELLRAYEGMRRTRGVATIEAIWAARYPTSEVDAYLTEEAADLQRRPAVKIERLVSSDVVNYEARKLLRESTEQLPNLVVWETDPVVLECNLCEYVHERSTFTKALVVLGGADKAAQVAISLDTRSEPMVEGVVHALKTWFRSLERRPMHLTALAASETSAEGEYGCESSAEGSPP